ncbi:MAG TPA: hypothetical protein VN873_06640 [Candidatus Angelobacter sp.]|nr:hypothetical protein [Candidatus Angelobacter sp.]
MIALASDCLLFETSSGESIPFSAEMISVELTSDGIGAFDPEFLKHAASAVFHYFKHDLGRITVTVGEFAGALEKVLRGFGLQAEPPGPADEVEMDSLDRRIVNSDLRQLACESGKGFELFFFPRLRDELRQQLLLGPEVLLFRGLRSCVKQLTGARRWSARCRSLEEQIVEFLRNCFTTEANQADCALLVE